MSWKDTGIEYGIVVNRYTLARYRNRILKLFRRALARYRNRVWNSRQQIHPGKIQESDLQTLQTCPGRIHESSLELVVNRYTMERYRNRIFKLFRRALAGYRNRVWNIVVNRYTLASYRNRILELFRRTLARYRSRIW